MVLILGVESENFEEAKQGTESSEFLVHFAKESFIFRCKLFPHEVCAVL